MRFAFAIVLVLGVTSAAEAGSRHGGGGKAHSSASQGSHYPRSQSGLSGTGSSSSSHAVRGYTTQRGTYVAPRRQTNPDHTQRNNYSTKGNVNPSTGKTGTKSATH
jgi:hypothetical protein